MDRRRKEKIILLCIFLDVLVIEAACAGYIWLLSTGKEEVEIWPKAPMQIDAENFASLGRDAVAAAKEATVGMPYVTDSPLVNTALKEVGNKGGKKYWKWYGFNTHQPWCACFISWCADKNGYIRKGKIPRFAYVPEGENWYKTRNRWKDVGKYKPKAGDLIFFRKKNGRSSVHAGIVAGVADGRVYTVQGNSKDICRKKDYRLDDPRILGYGLVKESSR